MTDAATNSVLEDASHLLEKYEAFAIDLDGVVWLGEKLIDGAVDGLKAIRAAGKPLLLLTNNGGYQPLEVVARLKEGGFDLKPEELLTTSIVAREWIVENGLSGAPAFILAPAAVAVQLADTVSIRYVEAGQKAEIVLVGRDTELSYSRLTLAADAIRSGAAFISLNKDPMMPIEGGAVLPGTGSIVAAVEAASGRSATVLGKPELPMMRMASRALGTDRVLMIGDRLESDVQGAKNIGWDAALVLTGLSSNAVILSPQPEYVLSGLHVFAGGAQTP